MKAGEHRVRAEHCTCIGDQPLAVCSIPQQELLRAVNEDDNNTLLLARASNRHFLPRAMYLYQRDIALRACLPNHAVLSHRVETRNLAPFFGSRTTALRGTHQLLSVSGKRERSDVQHYSRSQGVGGFVQLAGMQQLIKRRGLHRAWPGPAGTKRGEAERLW
jgi:hypothetical protein